MSRTLSEALDTVRYHLRDRGNQPPAFTEPEYVMEVSSQVRALAGRLALGDDYVTGIVTTVAGTPNYTLPDTPATQYLNLYELRSQLYGLVIPIVSRQEFERWRQGSTQGVVGTGFPFVAMLRESSAQLLEVVFWPTPAIVLVFDGYRTEMPASFYVAGGLQMVDVPANIVLPFDDQAFEALCWLTARALFVRLGADMRASLQLADTAADDWPATAEALVRASRLRRIRTTARPSHVIQARRW